MAQNVTNPPTPLVTGQPPRARKRSRTRIALIISSSVLIIALLAVGAYFLFLPQVQPLSLPKVPANLTLDDLGLNNWQVYQKPIPAHILEDQSIQPVVQQDKDQIFLEAAFGEALIKQGSATRALDYLKAAAQSEPDNLRYTNDYRIALRDLKRYDEEHTFFEQLVAQHNSTNTVLNMALVYVDEMRSCPKPPDGLVCQAQDSSRSISTLNPILEQHPYNIVARFARGLNNLYWPTLMGHLPQAQTDLQYSVSLLKTLNSIKHTFTPTAYAALGDVFAKSNKTADARNVWLNGKNVDPQATILDQRLAIPQDKLVDQEDTTIRGLGVYVDTGIALFWS
ncbi:tetratricopeptide repeat protein [Tengunoibacter tsumagoiensis]|uniref:Tetratricopeptide repeat protein n=1 Tax=Tengunoibacter tsumagoiensis TaxID=2014871 RepID=A0A402A9C4_9CHLR|nr:hypothetical protein [Tengunoibacter tsumagoiensis]GCE15777.1 hypothetical protein KTT_56360 [Tengunoibacter tsumagoiensis]